MKKPTLASMAAAALACGSAFAQPSPPAPAVPAVDRAGGVAGDAVADGASPAAPPTQTITITGSSAGNSARVAGFGDVPLSRSPFSATVVGTAQLQDAGISSLADIARLDAGLADAYNAPGYWGQLAVRGFTLDNRFNVRRDGLPINAETVLPMGNKAALELLKGPSGLQAGTSAPGGLLNLVVKRPTAQALTSGTIEWVEPGTWALEADVSRRAGAFGWRLNASGRSAGVMPWPSSVTRISTLPPPATSTRMRRAPASSAFSTSSLTAEAGRSTTSPAAMRLAVASSSCRITGKAGLILGLAAFMPPSIACPRPAEKHHSRSCGRPTTTNCRSSARASRRATRWISSSVTARTRSLRMFT